MLDRLLSASFPGVEELRQQCPMLLVSETYTGTDPTVIFTIDTDKAPPADVDERIPIDAWGHDADGMSIYVHLHVVDGYIEELEVYRGDSYCLQREIDPFSFTVGNITVASTTSDSSQFRTLLKANEAESRLGGDGEPPASE